jgi:hypothetical protein
VNPDGWRGRIGAYGGNLASNPLKKAEIKQSHRENDATASYIRRPK